ncbi:MAG: endonuclease/exonuclease/phosphatase family protein [Mycobacterium sp.]
MWFRRRRVRLRGFDTASQRWQQVDAQVDGVARDVLTLTTYNIWFNDFFARQRYLAIAEVLANDHADVMVFQEVTDVAVDVLLSRPWIRDHYRSAWVPRGNYGMLLLSRVPVGAVSYTRLPTRLQRGFLRADLQGADGLVVCCVHLESGKSSSGLRARQLGKLFSALRGVDDVVVLGDFNMRDAENTRIGAPFQDVWPALRPADDGFTEDTSINLMRYDMKNKHRHVRFDRVLLKGWRWRATDIELLGTRAIAESEPRVFPSDHFGVRCRIVRATGDG